MCDHRWVKFISDKYFEQSFFRSKPGSAWSWLACKRCGQLATQYPSGYINPDENNGHHSIRHLVDAIKRDRRRYEREARMKE